MTMTRELLSRRRVLAYMAQGGLVAGLGIVSGCSNSKASSGGSTGSGNPPPVHFDVIVYGGTPGGVMAALASARAGARVALIEPTKHIGGILSSGLGQTDSLYKNYIGGLAQQFFLQVGQYYGDSGTPNYTFEPHVVEMLFNQSLKTANVTIYLGDQLVKISVQGQSITQMTLSGAQNLTATAWIDASYEGDLMAATGVSYRVGREAISDYQEPHAGWARSTTMTSVSALDSNGNLIPGVNDNPMEVRGNGDAMIMGYSYRCCLSNVPANMAPFPKPAGYDPGRYTGLARSIANGQLTKLSQIVTMSPTVSGKFDLLRSENPFSVNLIGGGWAYPDANPADRATIVQDHYNYVAGWLYYVANDPSVPASIQNELKTYGLALDEFTDNGNWPYQLYIREARRMIGQYVMTESDITTNIHKQDCVAIGTWYGDCQPCDAYSSIKVGPGDSDADVYIDGELDVSIQSAYQIPYGCILPGASQIGNLAVVCCPSSTHVAFSSLRVEPTYMMLGEAAGVAAGLAVQGSVNFSGVNVAKLQAALTSNGGILTL